MLAAERATEDDLSEMEPVVITMRQCLHDVEQYSRLDVELHLLIASASRNSTMYHLVESIRDPLENLFHGLRRRLTLDQQERIQILHEELFATIARGDAQAAGLAMTQHFEEAVMAPVQDELANAEVTEGGIAAELMTPQP